MATEIYVISIYRRGTEPGKEAAGLVERAGSGERKAFSSNQDLWSFLCGKSGPTLTTAARKRRTRGDG